jgi:hypothetical protein
MHVRQLAIDDVGLVATIDRSEHVDAEYRVVDGQLVQHPVTMAEIPTWDPRGSGPHSVAHEIDFCTSLIAGGGTMFGAFDGENFAGLTIVNPAFKPRSRIHVRVGDPDRFGDRLLPRTRMSPRESGACGAARKRTGRHPSRLCVEAGGYPITRQNCLS